MNDIKKIILDNYKEYPKSEIQDIFKLLYQNEFGCGHLIADDKSSFERLKCEWDSSPVGNYGKLFEPIGNGFSRMNIEAAKSFKIPIEIYHEMFLHSAEKKTGTIEGFLSKAEAVKELCIEGELPFLALDVDEFLRKWEKDGYTLFSHSDSYKNAYHPAYRVVFSWYDGLIPLLIKIYEMKDTGAVIAIDGRCGSGKTTLAKRLSEMFATSVIHMDDFFLPQELRTAQRLDEPGGNIHYERFCDEVINSIKNKEPIQYKVFDCSIMDYNNTAKIEKTPIIIIEGAYSMHPLFESVYDIKVFCDVDMDTQKDRIIKRNGAEGYIKFRDRWIPMEEKYFSYLFIKEKCDYIVSIG